MKELKILKVAGHSSVQAVSGSIVKSIEDNKEVELRAIGASSTNQMAKATAIARGILASKGLDLLVRVGFGETEIDGEKRTMMIFKLMY